VLEEFHYLIHENWDCWDGDLYGFFGNEYFCHFWYDDTAPAVMVHSATNYSHDASIGYIESMVKELAKPTEDSPHGLAMKEICKGLDFDCLAELCTLKEKFSQFKKQLRRTHKGQSARKITAQDRLHIYALVQHEKILKSTVAEYYKITTRSVYRIIEQLQANPEQALSKASTPLKKEVITQTDLNSKPS
jgi:hypothetical protein